MVQTLPQLVRTLESYSPPLLKWTGGKRLLLKHLVPLLPPTFNTYYEPFIGGGAVFFALRPRSAVLADRNAELTNCYIQVRDRPAQVIEILERWGSSECDYYRLRDTVCTDDISRAARLIYLTRLSFNGIYRLNARGEFNVPYGHRPHLGSGDSARIFAASEALQRARIEPSDFEDSTHAAAEGDLVYFDPPYAFPDDRTRFVRYNDRNFSWADQLRLAAVVARLTQRGVKVVVSNADHPEIRRLYSALRCFVVTRNSSIAANGKQRRPTTECIFYNEG
jgi:DNA adenine methylase